MTLLGDNAFPVISSLKKSFPKISIFNISFDYNIINGIMITYPFDT